MHPVELRRASILFRAKVELNMKTEKKKVKLAVFSTENSPLCVSLGYGEE